MIILLMERKNTRAKHEFHDILVQLNTVTDALVEDARAVIGVENTKRFMEDYSRFIGQYDETEAEESKEILIDVEQALKIRTDQTS